MEGEGIPGVVTGITVRSRRMFPRRRCIATKFAAQRITMTTWRASVMHATAMHTVSAALSWLCSVAAGVGVDDVGVVSSPPLVGICCCVEVLMLQIWSSEVVQVSSRLGVPGDGG